MKVELNKTQIAVIITALESALAGEYDEGDCCWTEREADEAEKASEKLKELLPPSTEPQEKEE